jgi:hypothetical protein
MRGFGMGVSSSIALPIADQLKPLSVVTLGLSPTKKVSVITTASGLLVDTRTGYVYAAYEATEKAGTLATSWGSEDAADKARQKTEQQAFAKLVDEFISTWPDVLKRHQPKA